MEGLSGREREVLGLLGYWVTSELPLCKEYAYLTYRPNCLGTYLPTN